MISNREVALTILKGRRYLNELKDLTQNKTVTLEQINQVAHKHKLHPGFGSSLFYTGFLTGYEVINGKVKSKSVNRIEQNKTYLVYWNFGINDVIAYDAVLASLNAKRISALHRFYQCYPQEVTTQCLQCGKVSAMEWQVSFCSIACEREYEKQFPLSGRQKKKVSPAQQKNRQQRLVKSVKEFIHVNFK